jgi:glycosyltransferase involved in cell wall biosynthesis
VKDILWVTPVAPDRSGGGGHIRQAHLLLALASESRVHLVSSEPVRDPQIRSAVASLVELDVSPYDWSSRPKTHRRLRDLSLIARSSEPREVADFRPVRRAMRQIVRDLSADAVILEYAGLAPLVRYRHRLDQKWILTLHNVPSVMSAQEARIVSGRRRWIRERDAAIASEWEHRVCRRFDEVIVVSANDARALGRLPSKVRIIPNGVDVERYRPSPIPPEPRIVFTGALYTLPNSDGITWFCRDILPRVRDRHPDAVLDIAGARPGRSLEAITAIPGVRLHADVASTAPLLEGARVVVVPLRIGSGTRLKALEGLAAGRPVVGTTIGLEGLDLVNGRHALIADDAESFASAISMLFADEDVASSLAREGRALVEERFDWQQIAAAFMRTLWPGV